MASRTWTEWGVGTQIEKDGVLITDVTACASRDEAVKLAEETPGFRVFKRTVYDSGWLTRKGDEIGEADA